ncbi:MAG TPA: SDR family oxidoreductase [Nevskiaceae bacterium]|nr:SDR family oxidoreductase [Nevskiaceae bacterium]
MQGLLEGKVAIVTGAGSGVGREAVLLFTAHGAKVIAADIDAARVEETVALAKAKGGTARAEVCNVADAEAVNRVVQAAVTAFGRLDVMYNNAGVTASTQAGKGIRTLVETGPEDIARMQDINVNGVIFGCQAAIRQFEAQGGGGVIVNTASVAGLIGYGSVVYGASKGAVAILTRGLALELAAKGIRVNSVCPSGMLTHFAGMDPEGPMAERIRAGMDAAAPTGRRVTAEDCAKAALFLASDLSSSITGVNLPVDAGLSAGVPMRR